MRSTLCRAAFALMLALTAGQSLRAAENCGIQTFKGIYAAISWGSLAGWGDVGKFLPELVGPFARAGIILPDGKGNVVMHSYASFNGFIEPRGFDEKMYTVTPDCALTLNMGVPLPLTPPGFTVPITVTGIIANSGREFAGMIVSPPGESIRLLLIKQDKDSCSNEDLRGSYGLDMWGTIVNQPPNPSGGFTRDGRVIFDGIGGFTARSWVSYDGNVVQENISGTYLVDSSCRLTMQYTNGLTYTWRGGLADNSKTATVIVVDPPGAVVVGTLKQQ